MKLPARIYCEPNVILDGVQLLPDIHIGLATYMNQGTIRSLTAIGRYCSIGRRVTIGAAKHPIEWLTSHPFVFERRFRPEGLSLPAAPTKIGNDVWVGDNVVIMEGVTVGDGAILGATAVVTKDVAPYAIIAGVPSKPLRSRFPEPIVERLLKLRWWQYHPRHLIKLPFNDIEKCLDLIDLNEKNFEPLPDQHRDHGS